MLRVSDNQLTVDLHDVEPLSLLVVLFVAHNPQLTGLQVHNPQLTDLQLTYRPKVKSEHDENG